VDSQESNRQPDRPDEVVLRTFALLIGVVLAVIGLAGLAADWLGIGAVVRAVSLGGGTSGSMAALLVGAALVYWGVRPRRADHPVSEEALSKLIEKYERQGNSEQLAEARERLIQLLIDKDERKNRQERA
jgi:hypothetical protein